jgi:TRAP-type uncharacterized transport system fused permease subunit
MASLITPPVCFNAYIAAGFAGGDPLKTGWIASRLGIASYIVPFLFCLYPVLVLQGSLSELPRVLITTIAGAAMLSSALAGYLLTPMNWLQRGLALVGAFMLLIQGPLWLMPRIGVDLTGLVIVLFLLLWQYRARRGSSMPVR